MLERYLGYIVLQSSACAAAAAVILIMAPSKVLASSCNPVHNRDNVLLCHIFSVYPSQNNLQKTSYDTVCRACQ